MPTAASAQLPALPSGAAPGRGARMIHAILILLCIAYAGPAAAIAYAGPAAAKAKPAKKIEIMTCTPPKYTCTCPQGVPGQATCCPTSDACACSDTMPLVPFCK